MPQSDILRSYSELIKLPTFLERFNYLKLDGIVGEETFGSRRYLNQRFYASSEWKRLRDQVIVRDDGCDLGIDGRTIFGPVYIHHLNPITLDDIIHARPKCTDLDNLICISYETHQAIHYGDFHKLSSDPIERTPNDTCPWKL